MTPSSFSGGLARTPGMATPRPVTGGKACSTRDLCVVLHDVAPSRWEGCQRVLGHVRRCADAAGIELPLTLLVVPHMHGDTALPARYLRWLHRMAGAGHELCLHGLTHRDEGPPARGLREHLLRRHYTAGEGEFAALTREQALAKLREGRAWAKALGLSMDGFVAPAWLMSPASLKAVGKAGFRHTCTLTEVIALPQRQALKAPSLVFSTRAAWRRQLSRAWNTYLAHQARDTRLLRLELHPGDAEHPDILRCWTGLLTEALRSRMPLRLGEAAMLARRLG
ncbi:polysaccharide deacetylase family protein [Pelomonas aquatica]|nr:polysaccharide deacetylase family protein [Pelomonas aquatica]